MHLLDLPHDILCLVARELDTVSLATFQRLHPRLLEASKDVRDLSVKAETITGAVLDSLILNGDRVCSLDLENCRSSGDLIQEVTKKCPRTTELNLVNSALQYSRFLEVLQPLKELTTLKLTLTASEDIVLSESQRQLFRNVRTLYVEIRPYHPPMALLIDLMNECDSLEKCHINIVGDAAFPHRNDALLPSLEAKRWTTLHTFICTSYHSENQRARVKLLECVFAENSSEAVQRWLRSDRKCFVFERGCFNGIPANPEADANEERRVLKRYLEVELTEDNDQASLFETKWGKPTSLRIVDPSRSQNILSYHDLNRCLTTALIELDFSNCHCVFEDATKLDLASLAPCLETLAVPQCFLFPTWLSCGIRRRSDLPKVFPNTLSGLDKLRKFIVKAERHRPGCDAMGCNCASDWNASKCSGCRAALTSIKLPALKPLVSLEELTLDNVWAMNDLYRSLEHPKIRTVRLNLRDCSEVEGLGSFLKACPSLRKFQLKVGETVNTLTGLPHDFWRDLADGPCLDQLCLEADRPRSVSAPVFLSYVGRILEKTKLFHLHNPRRSVSDSLVRRFFGLRALEEHGRTVLVAEKPPAERNPGDRSASGRFPGRFLCCGEPLVGYVKPSAWE